MFGSKSSKTKNIYLTPEAIRKKDLKNKLWRRYKKSRCEYDRARYIRIKNELRTMTRTLRIQFEYNIAQDVKNSPKKFWSYVKSKTKVQDPKSQESGWHGSNNGDCQS